ncbi:MAG: hypothetical protein FWC16_00710 [Defluviitaleaceae bacterium]|nr:hypothetical protein [Defluviitaleaceae bacterium]MCL2273425.1 hypothetical protein [Defluviitaleaceae bacterium]
MPIIIYAILALLGGISATLCIKSFIYDKFVAYKKECQDEIRHKEQLAVLNDIYNLLNDSIHFSKGG